MSVAVAPKSKWRSYPKYKSSNTEWLGDIPSHWDKHRLKFATRLINYKLQASESSLPYLGLEHIESWTGKKIPSTSETSCEGQANTYEKGDVLFGKLRPYLAKVLAADEDGICSGELLALRPSDVNQRFLFYYLLNPQLIGVVDSSTYGAKMPRANWEFIGSLSTLIPPLDEQHAIAAFLDRETARIDALIEKKQRQIELLQEKRAALISHAVTKGLDRDAKMKDSGIEWLGQIPEHWIVGNIRRFATMKTGHTPSRNQAEYWQHCTIPWFTLADVWQLRDGRRKFLQETKEKISDVGLANSAAELLPAGTVVFSRTASIGFSGIMPVPMATTQDFWNWICGPDVMPEYLLYLFRSMDQEFQALTMGSTHRTIYQPVAASICICVPPASEQAAIVDFIDRDVERIFVMIDRIQHSIDLLREYRTALISAAVTGKIDVRNEVA